MPIYEYKCDKCGKVIEILQKLNEEYPPVHCVKCGGMMNKLVSKTNFKLKGKGWAKDGYENS